MKKGLYILLFAMFILLCGCQTNESGGVPDSLVLSDLSYIKGDYLLDGDYSLSHNIDSDAHIDTVYIQFLNEETEYARQYRILSCRYQYDKSTDLWTLLGYGGWVSRTELKDAIFSQETWTGFSDNPLKSNQFSYSIMVDRIDLDTMTITLTNYVLIYNHGTVSQNTPVTLNLYYDDYLRCYTFELDISSIGNSSGYTIFELSEDGLIPCDFGD